MPAEVAGVPLHPLVVHAVVVLLPLAATGVLLMAVVPSWRGRYGSLVAVTALVGTALVPVATMSGEELEETVPATDALERHTELGESILAGAVPLLVVAFLLWWIGRRADRDRLITSLTKFVFPVEGDRGWNYAEVTAGGIPLEEINFRTMESKIVPGLHLVGEILDCDGRIGGFNFHWAWATGYLAGRASVVFELP